MLRNLSPGLNYNPGSVDHLEHSEPKQLGKGLTQRLPTLKQPSPFININDNDHMTSLPTMFCSSTRK